MAWQRPESSQRVRGAAGDPMFLRSEFVAVDHAAIAVLEIGALPAC